MAWGPYRAIVVAEHDGDTVELDIHLAKRHLHIDVPKDLGFGVQLRKDGVWLAAQRCRTFGDNAAELSTPGGKAALAYLQSILPLGAEVTVLSQGYDKYADRCDATITLPDGSDLVTRMVEAGYAAVWNGQGPKPVPPYPPASS
jgi:micrococcal nuclease